MPVTDTVGAFCKHGREEFQTRSTGLLAGVTFGVKDLYDVAGLPTGAGNPDWLATHDVPTATAPAVQRLLDAGARFAGKTHTDELAWSLNGQNIHYGTPVNVAAPGRIPGGSSSGSAAATAAGIVGFALGSDTGGSVRLPASYCGLYGMRSSHGRIPLAGAMPLAPSYDTVGWFARDALLFANVGKVLLQDDEPAPLPRRVLLAEDLFELAGSHIRAALADGISAIEDRFGKAETIIVAGSDITDWRNTFRLIQAAEIWEEHKDWISRANPKFGPGVRERFAAAAHMDYIEVAAARKLRTVIRRRLEALIGQQTILLLPSASGIAPLLAAPESEMEKTRAVALSLLCPAGHAGFPQISLPAGSLDGCPIGLSVMAARNADTCLLDLAADLARHSALPGETDGRA